MNGDPRDEPEIVTHRIPKIEVYQITEQELERIEEGIGSVSQDLTFAVASLSAGISFLIALLAGTLSQTVFITFTIIVIVCGVVFLYTGIKWWRTKRITPNVIARIRSRRIEPEVTPKN